MRIWHLKRLILVSGAVCILGFILLFLSGSKSGLATLNFLESAQIDRIERFKQKIQLPIIHARSDVGKNKSCSFPNGNVNSSLGPKVFLDKATMQKIIQESQPHSTHLWPADTESLFDENAIRESGLPLFKSRIPAVVYHKNTFLAFSEARFDGLKDFGHILLVMRRGDIKGHDIIWGRIKLLINLSGFRTNNPSPIVDKVRDSIVLVFAAFPTELSFHDMMSFPRFPMSKLYVMKTYDLGDTWTTPDDITSQTVLKVFPVPVLFVPGPGHNIQLKCGRIIVPCNYFTQEKRRNDLAGLCQNCSNYNRIIYSDDGGNTWIVGGRSRFKRDPFRIPIYPNEVMAVELDQSIVSLNSRTLNFQQTRAVLYSFDGGMTLSDPILKEELVEPGWKVSKHGKATPRAAAGCQGSLIGFPAPKGVTVGQKTWVILSNPADRVERQNLAVRLSIDGCQTWSTPLVIHKVFAAYSDLAYFEVRDSNGMVVPYLAMMFEGGLRMPHEYVKFQVFSLSNILNGLFNATGR
ncbi:sialidase-3-like [Diadema antillarum]|uniref:sialidase-3-like n=1 Tax=Diadema antillarum TaxID=105358 RepID=UPI003A8670EE